MVNSMDYSFLNPASTIQASLTTKMMESMEKMSDGSEEMDFKEMMNMMIPMMGLSMMSSSFSTDSSSSTSMMGGGDSMGMNFTMMMMPMMMELMERLLEDDINSSGETGEYDALNIQGVADAEGIHINQFTAELEVGGDGANANCGPTSLAITLHALGMSVAGEGKGMNDGLIVDLARRSMIADPARDGVGANGVRSEAEHSTWTNFADLTMGAKNAGAGVEKIIASSSSVESALETGAKVIISGTFTGKSPLPWTGDRGIDNGSAPGGATNHIVAVTGYDPESGNFIVNDPARKSPHLVNATTLDYFMLGNAGAISLTSS